MSRLFFLFLLPVLCFAEIHEIKTLEELNTYLKPESLVVFDIDNTLIEPEQELGSDQWFEKRLSFYQSQGLSSSQAFEKTYDEYYQIQSVTKVRPVEAGTVRLVRSIDKKNRQMALTTRGYNLSYATLKQLSSVGLNFQNSPVARETYVFSERGVLYKNGVLFTDGTHKGRSFLAFLNQAALKPKAVIYVNDKLGPLKELEAECVKNRIGFIGLRYGFLDQKVQEFNRSPKQRALPVFSGVLLEKKHPSLR
ncbi:MAG: DUF2608 domain-containing protein [Parachlamydiales bacterium]|jgi:FMN phosphatase YigB (HAD superfamily)